MRAQEFIAENTIKLSPQQRAYDWIQKVYAQYPQTWQNNHVMPMGGSGEDQQFAMFELTPSNSRRDAVEVKWFQAYPLRAGVGTRAMKELQRLAQADGIALTLYPWDKGQVSQAKLMKFYRGQGFRPINQGGKNMTWDPVAETFNNPYKTKLEKSEYGDIDMLAKLPDGTNLSIMFNNQQDDEGKEMVQVEFYRNNSQEVTGEGDAQRIFATVLASIQKYIKKYKPARLSFSASKATDPTIYYEPDQPQPNPESRAKLYDRLVQRYARAWGYRAFRADTGDLVIYELSRIAKGLAESKTVEYNGITLRVTKPTSYELKVEALDDWGNKVLGYVEFDIGDSKELDPQDLRVDDRFQGQGIAKTMYDYVKSLGYKIVRSWDQTDAGAGFWNKHRGEDVRVWEDQGQGAAGIILYAADTGRYGLQQRSDSINDPGLWAAWGGGREPEESLEQCAQRELAEESGYTGPVELHHLASNPKYTTFIGVVPAEFEPRPDPEWKDFCWVEAGDWPSPMHPGVAAALKNIPVNENFADGKVKGKSRPGRVKRSGASCDGSVTDLRARAKRASGEKARMYHWCANMKSGRNK